MAPLGPEEGPRLSLPLSYSTAHLHFFFTFTSAFIRFLSAACHRRLIRSTMSHLVSGYCVQLESMSVQKYPKPVTSASARSPAKELSSPERGRASTDRHPGPAWGSRGCLGLLRPSAPRPSPAPPPLAQCPPPLRARGSPSTLAVSPPPGPLSSDAYKSWRPLTAGARGGAALLKPLLLRSSQEEAFHPSDTAHLTRPETDRRYLKGRAVRSNNSGHVSSSKHL